LSVIIVSSLGFGDKWPVVRPALEVIAFISAPDLDQIRFLAKDNQDIVFYGGEIGRPER